MKPSTKKTSVSLKGLTWIGYVNEVKASLSTIYFKMVDGSIYGLNHKGKPNISFTQATLLHEEKVYFERIHLKLVHNIVKIYSGIDLLNKDNATIALITHGKFVSKYDLINLKWLSHVEYEDDIIRLFRCEALINYYPIRCQCILLANGAIYVNISAIES